MTHDDDDPVDLRAVTADEVAVEALRRPRAVSPDVREGVPASSEDAALALLQDLLADVRRDVLPDHGRPPLRTVAVPARPVGLLRRGTAVTAVTVGVLSLTGVAAASTFVPAGAPLHGLGDAVRSAAGAVRDAVVPEVTAGSRTPLPATSPTTSPAATTATTAITRTTPTTRTDSVPVVRSTTAVDARSRAAADQVGRWLDEATRHLAAGRTKQATDRLDQVERRLPEVLPADGAAALAERLKTLRAEVAAAASDKPARTARPERTAKAEPSAKAPAEQKSEPEPEKAPEKAPKKAPKIEPETAAEATVSDAPAKPVKPTKPLKTQVDQTQVDKTQDDAAP